MNATVNSHIRSLFTNFSVLLAAKYLFLHILFMLLLMNHATGQSLHAENIPEAYINSFGNEVLLSLTFDDKEAGSAALALTLAESSGVASNVKIVERKDLSSESKRFFAVTFDIAPDVAPGSEEKLVFVPSSNQLLTYDRDTLQFSFRAIAADQEEEKASTENKNRGPSRLILTSVRKYVASQKSVSDGELYSKNGYVNESCYYDKCDYSMNTREIVEVEELPSVIHIGEPFSVKASRLFSMKLPEDGFLDFSRYHGYRVSTQIDVNGHDYEAHGLKSMKAGDETRVETSPGKLSGYRQKAWSDQDKVSLSLDFIFDSYEGINEKSGMAEGFNYKLSKHKTDGQKYRGSSFDLNVEYPDESSSAYKEKKNAGVPDFYIVVGALTFIYSFSDDTGSAMTVEKIKIPSGFPDTHDKAQSVADSTQKSDKEMTKVSNVAGMSKKQAEEKLKGEGLNTKVILGSPAPVKEESLNEPGSLEPESLVPEIIETEKDMTIPDLTGQKAEEAKRVLTDKGFKVTMRAGKSAPSPEKAFTVSEVNPMPGSMLKEGQAIEIIIFVDYLPQATIPDVAGKSVVEARKKLEDAGFKVNVKTLGNSPDPDKAFKAVGTDPGIASGAPKGSTITLITYGPFKDRVQMPSLIGLYLSQAELELEKLGLEVFSRPGEEAPSRQENEKVTAQEPPAGEIVSPRSRIELTYYRDFVWKGAMPDLTGLTSDSAREKLEPNGIRVHVDTGMPAPSMNQVGRIYKQSVSVNSIIKESDYVVVAVYGKTKTQLVELTDCARYPNTEAFWDENAGRTGCGCKSGYLLRADSSGCDRRIEPVPVSPPVQPEEITPPPVKKLPAPAGGLPQVTVEGDSTGTRLVLEKVIYSKYQAPEDLCKTDQNCRHTSRVASGVLLDDYFFNDNGRAEYRFKETYQSTGDVLSDYTVEFFYNIPPSEIHAGDTLVLNISGTARGDAKGWHIGRRFTYYIKQPGNNYFDKTDVYFSLRDLPKDGQRYRGSLSKQTVTRIPIPKRVKDTLVIGGRNGQDPAIYVDWVYRVVPDSQGTGGSKPAAGKNTSSCDQYSARLNSYMTEQQKISSRMMSDPGNSSSYACDLLKVNRLIIDLAKEARASGCKIDGNLDAASKQLISTYQQMCK